MGIPQCASTSDGQLAQRQGAGIGVLGGGLLGAAIGGIYGTHVANRKSKYKSTEEWLDACITQAESTRKEAIAYNQQLDNQLARLQKDVKMARSSGDKSKLTSLKREIGSQRAAAEKQASAFSKEAEMQRAAIKQANGEGSSRLQSLRTSASGIETQVSTMNKNVQHYAALESQTDV
jgi:cell division septum initiation protein DivIVA